MRKIPTVFARDFEHSNGRYVTRTVTPGCEWVLDGEGWATRKFDGTCVMFDGFEWYSRREVKEGKTPPPDFQSVENDTTTGKVVGWEPMEASGFRKFFEEAAGQEKWTPGTYELCGPKINGNPEEFSMHVLVRHGIDDVTDAPRDFDGLRDWLLTHPAYEGIVWWRDGEPAAKLKRRDFPVAEPYEGPRPNRDDE